MREEGAVEEGGGAHKKQVEGSVFKQPLSSSSLKRHFRWGGQIINTPTTTLKMTKEGMCGWTLMFHPIGHPLL